MKAQLKMGSDRESRKRAWEENELSSLAKAIVKFPAGSQNRESVCLVLVAGLTVVQFGRGYVETVLSAVVDLRPETPAVWRGALCFFLPIFVFPLTRHQDANVLSRQIYHVSPCDINDHPPPPDSSRKLTKYLQDFHRTRYTFLDSGRTHEANSV